MKRFGHLPRDTLWMRVGAGRLVVVTVFLDDLHREPALM